MILVVSAGPEGNEKWIQCDPATGEVTGDPAMVQEAEGITKVLLHPEEGPVPIDWKDPDKALTGLREAAGRVYGDATVRPPRLPDGFSDDEVRDHILYGL